MNITRENLSDLDFRIKIEIEESDYAEKVNKQLKTYRQKANIKGFRPGAAPMDLVKRLYKTAIIADEVQETLNEELYKYIDNEKLEIVGAPLANNEMTPTPDFKSQTSFTFYFDAALMPKVNIDWSKIDIKMTSVKVDKKEIDSQIENITRQNGKFESPEEIGENDFIYGKAVELDKEGNEKKDGMNIFCSFELNTVKDEEIRKSFYGKKKDDKVTFAANKAFNTEGIERNFRLTPEEAKKFKSNIALTISGCSRITPHELNNELFEKVFPGKDIKDADAFRKAVAADIEDNYNEQSEILFANQVRRTLIANLDTPMPEAFMKRWILSRNENKELTAEQLDADWAEKYLPSLKWEFIEYALMQIQNLTPTHEELVDEYKTIIRNYGAVPTEGTDEEKEAAITRMANSLASENQNSRQVADRIYHRKLVSLFREQLKPEIEKVSVKEFTTRAKAENENK